MKPVGDLADIIAQVETVSVRLALVRDVDRWTLTYGEVTLGADPAGGERCWRYHDDLFVETSLPGTVVAELFQQQPQHIAEIEVSAPATQPTCNFQRLAAYARWNNYALPFPRTEWDVNPAENRVSTRPRAILVGDGPSFLSAEAAFNAFFYATTVENGPQRPHRLWSVVELERRGWINRVTIAPDTLTVSVEGDALTGAQLELTTPHTRTVHPIGGPGRLRLPLPKGLAPATLLILRTEAEWWDFRYFPAPGSGGAVDQSVDWELPVPDAGTLIAGGENEQVEFKRDIPTDDKSKRTVVKTVAAFASGQGGTLLLGIDDDGQIAGIDATDLDAQMLKVRAMIRDLLEPDPPVEVRPLELNGKTILLVEVNSGGRWHVYYASGSKRPEFFVRRGASTLPANLREIEVGFTPPHSQTAFLNF